MRKLWWLTPILVLALWLIWIQKRSASDAPLSLSSTLASTERVRSAPVVAGTQTESAYAKVAPSSDEKLSQHSSSGTHEFLRGPVIRNEDDFRRAFPGEWSVGKGPDGRPQYIAGGPLPVGLTSGAQALPLISRLAPFLGIEASQFSSQPATVTSETADTRTIEAKQFVDGYEVFDGRVIIHSRNTDGAVFIIDNLSRVVRTYSRQLVYNQDQARDMVLTHYGINVIDVSFEKGPLIFAGETSTELAFVFVVKVRDPKTRVLRAVFGAASGAIIDEIETSHD